MTGAHRPLVPSENRAYVKEGVIQAVILWSQEDLVYLAVQAGVAMAKSELAEKDVQTFTAGKLGELKIEGESIILAKSIAFDKDNIDDYDF